jgi:hypothetical protein
MMREEVVVKKKWLEEQHFLDLIGATNLIPGPNSTEMAIHIGHERAGWKGLIVAGFCFIVPAVLITGIFACFIKTTVNYLQSNLFIRYKTSHNCYYFRSYFSSGKILKNSSIRDYRWYCFASCAVAVQ